MKSKLISFVLNHYILILFVLLCISFVFQTKMRYEASHQQLIKENINEMKSITILYESKIHILEDKISNYEKNNILYTKTTTKKNGERTIISYRDLSTKSSIENKNVTNFEDIVGEKKEDMVSVRRDEFNVISNIQSNDYIAGILNTQALSSNLSDYSGLIGVKVFSLPLFIAVSVPFTSEFYKHPTTSLLLNF